MIYADYLNSTQEIYKAQKKLIKQQVLQRTDLRVIAVPEKKAKSKIKTCILD